MNKPKLYWNVYFTGSMAIVTVVLCCVSALAITSSLHCIDKDLLGWWLSERQVKSGGLNGRPEKLPNVGYSFLNWDFLWTCDFYHWWSYCVTTGYSWWVLSSLIMIDRVHWIDMAKLVKFILDCKVCESNKSLLVLENYPMTTIAFIIEL